jgi:hypothetical protein
MVLKTLSWKKDTHTHTHTHTGLGGMAQGIGPELKHHCRKKKKKKPERPPTTVLLSCSPFTALLSPSAFNKLCCFAPHSLSLGLILFYDSI